MGTASTQYYYYVMMGPWKERHMRLILLLLMHQPERGKLLKISRGSASCPSWAIGV